LSIDLAACIALLKQQGQSIGQLASGLSAEQARWKPNADSWSIIEVVNHLYDEEREDFRAKIKHILGRTGGMPPEIDPEAWVTERRYNEHPLETSIAQFWNERDSSLTWLATQAETDWDTAIEVPMGRFTAGDMLLAWMAHDLLHLRQLVELRYAYLSVHAAPYSVDYAGRW
jgi:hypothetical protein